jgi:hypothetical protein
LVNSNKKQTFNETQHNYQKVEHWYEILVLWVNIYKSEVVKYAINPKLRKVNNVPPHEVREALLLKLDHLDAKKGDLGAQAKSGHGIV